MNISLRHNNHTLPNRVEPFYDGITVAVGGVITLDSSELEHLRAAYFRGYNTTMDGKRLYGFTDLDAYIASETAKSAGEGQNEPRKKSSRINSRG
jgi:hypothetical protein